MRVGCKVRGGLVLGVQDVQRQARQQQDKPKQGSSPLVETGGCVCREREGQVDLPSGVALVVAILCRFSGRERQSSGVDYGWDLIDQWEDQVGVVVTS